MHFDFRPLLRRTLAELSRKYPWRLALAKPHFWKLGGAFGACFLKLQLSSTSSRSKDVLQDHGIWLLPMKGKVNVRYPSVFCVTTWTACNWSRVLSSATRGSGGSSSIRFEFEGRGSRTGVITRQSPWANLMLCSSEKVSSPWDTVGSNSESKFRGTAERISMVDTWRGIRNARCKQPCGGGSP